ncbi:tetratricopeptide (TPR) repeat protein [Kibdelosporangium banguiense]|uniref:Tetratricopeptide (TPR) repeat protein n=1 Tax=Kibdelosporangium banguiense TaxID=1365924 RepID=A0ABS4T820_9PSEU|nr:tetratricopeptide repeat protein [Kibdelosporangium banguiense]MBP2320003.1 tetratricopeptide (TPR) repeat protein [Kibdelosporangium banguiense]
MADTRNEVSSAVTGPVFQAGAVHGDVHFHSPDLAALIPRQLVAPPAHFANRHQELADLESAATQSDRRVPAVVLLKGQGGVGKTALALRWLDQARERFPDGQLHAELSHPTGEPVAPDEILGQFLRALGIAPNQVPVSLAERTALFRSMTAERKLAVLLDNAVTAAQVRVLVPASPDSLVVVTSRRPLIGLLAAGATTIPVSPLTDAGAIELLERHVGAERVATERGPAQQLARLCGGLPLALCVAAALTVSRPTRSLTWMARELVNEERRLEVLSVEEDLSVRSTFDLSYRDLPPAAAVTYQALGLHHGAVFRLDLVAAATNTPVSQASQAGDHLLDASLVDELGDGYFRLQDLVQAHANTLAGTSDQIDPAVIRRRMIEWYLVAMQTAGRTVLPARRVLSFEPSAEPTATTGLDDPQTALRWMERQRVDVLAAVRAAEEHGWPDLAYLLADALQPLFLVYKNYQDAIEIGTIGLRSARATGNPAGENSVRKSLARTYIQLGRVEEAHQQISSVLENARANGNRRAEASGLKSLAMLHARTGHFERAVEYFHPALEILRELGTSREQGLMLIELGTALLEAGRLEEAERHLSEAHGLLADSSTSDRLNAARAATALGLVHVHLGDHTRAQQELHTALEALTELGFDVDRGRTHQALAELHASMGNAAEAQNHRDSAARLLTRSPSPNEDD